MKKRKLPEWMTSIHKQSKARATSKDDVADMNSGNLPVSKEKNHFSTDEKIAVANSAPRSVQPIESKCASDFISDSMPLLKMPGKIIYSYETADCACICEEVLSSLDSENKVIVGFDMEWPVSYKKGSVDRTALIQMYFGNNNNCYLFQVSGMSCLPRQLAKLICHENLILVGLNIECDLWKLERDYNVFVKPIFDRRSVIDVGHLANKKLKSSERWDLNGLCKNVLRRQLNKEHAIRCGNWEDIPLSEEQINYSSVDAYAGFALYDKLVLL